MALVVFAPWPLLARNLYYPLLQEMDVHAHPYLEQLLARADELRLHQQRSWRLLGHYEEQSFSGLRSDSNRDNFFLAADGRDNPEAELRATLSAMFLELRNPAHPELDPDYHPRCLFPARYKWLSRQLQIDPARLPPIECKTYNKLMRATAATRVHLVFATYYAGDPASMFGHTFFRFEKPGGNFMHDDGLNFAAYTMGVDPLSYVVFGLVGGFKGNFHIVPYRDLVIQYTLDEDRDMWEYQLNLTADEIETMQMHIWELSTTNFDYFYLYGNCSYRLLSLLELIRPEHDLRGQFHARVIPGDTIKAV